MPDVVRSVGKCADAPDLDGKAVVLGHLDLDGRVAGLDGHGGIDDAVGTGGCLLAGLVQVGQLGVVAVAALEAFHVDTRREHPRHRRLRLLVVRPDLFRLEVDEDLLAVRLVHDVGIFAAPHGLFVLAAVLDEIVVAVRRMALLESPDVGLVCKKSKRRCNELKFQKKQAPPRPVRQAEPL